MTRNKEFKVGQKIIVGKCASYQYDYDDFDKYHICHEWKMRKCQCQGNLFKMLACPYYDKPIKCRSKVTVTKDDLKTYEDEKIRIENVSKGIEEAERRL